MRVSLSYFEQILGEREFRKKPGRYLISWVFISRFWGLLFAATKFRENGRKSRNLIHLRYEKKNSKIFPFEGFL